MELENRMADMSLVSKFDVNDTGIDARLFQTGYLTIADEQRDDFESLCRLYYPNLEVRLSLNRAFMRHLGRPVVEASRSPGSDTAPARGRSRAADQCGGVGRLSRPGRPWSAPPLSKRECRRIRRIPARQVGAFVHPDIPVSAHRDSGPSLRPRRRQ